MVMIRASRNFCRCVLCLYPSRASISFPTQRFNHFLVVVIAFRPVLRKFIKKCKFGSHNVAAYTELARRLIIRDDKAVASKYIADYIISMRIIP